jgi:cephalosporin hydroxylase
MIQKTVVDFKKANPRYQWNYTWQGHKIIQYPDDIIALQEIIYRTRPEVIVECGIAYGGMLLFYRHMLDLNGGGDVVGVELHPRITEINTPVTFWEHPDSGRVHVVEGSSVDPLTIMKVYDLVGCRPCMVILDSNHSTEHVLREMRAYGQLVKPGYYLVVSDTEVDELGIFVGPGKAVTRFFAEEFDSARFSIDYELEAHIPFTCSPGGWLKCVS